MGYFSMASLIMKFGQMMLHDLECMNFCPNNWNAIQTLATFFTATFELLELSLS